MLISVLRAALVVALSAVFLLLSIYKFPTGLPHDIFHELGFALLVSLIIWTLFELHRATQADAEWARRISNIGENVFLAVLRKDLPQKLMDEANALVFHSSIIRSAFNVHYTLSNARFEIVTGQMADCTLVSAVVSFRMQNIGADPIDYPISVSLPDPIHPKLKELVRVNDISIMRGERLEPLQLHEARERFQQQLNSGSHAAVTFEAGEVRLAPKEIVEFRADYVMAKEPEDSELLQTSCPCDGLTVTVVDVVQPQQRVVFARSVHRHPLENQSSVSSPGTKIFRLSHYLFPHQGVLIWWKKSPVV